MNSTTMAEANSPAASAWPSRTSIPLTPQERDWPARTYSIIYEVLGPDFHGPSSSHTAAPQLIALDAYDAIGGVPDFAHVTLFNSFATTGEGHRTHIAVLAGLLGLATTDPRTPEAVELARDSALTVVFEKLEDASEHPNTLVLELTRGRVKLHVKGISIGGGNFEIIEKTSGLLLAA